FVLVNTAREDVDERLDALLPTTRRLERQAADAKITGHHALPGIHLEDAQDVFALAEAVEKYRHGADVDSVRPEPHQVAVEARELGKHHARPLRHGWDLDSQQLFDGQAVAEIVRERR